jgi:hypothetical protein
MSNNESSARISEKGYRKGVLLGLTIAEIILLILFALLLALFSRIITLQETEERASALINRFGSALSASEKGNDKKFVTEIEKAIQLEIDYAKKLADALVESKNRLLPEDIYEAVISKKFDFNNQEDRNKFIQLMNLADSLSKENPSAVEQQKFCAIGASLPEEILKSSDPVARVTRQQSDISHWKKKAEACGNGTEFPPCYESINGQFVYVYDAYLKDDGILLKQTVPDEKIQHFNTNFKSPPQTNISLTPDEFYRQANQFLTYGRNNSCRFFVRAFDDTSTNKIYFQKMDKNLQMIFYRKPMW